MEFMSSPPGIADEYFSCWRRHDVVRLKKIFAADAKYEIRGKDTLQGIDNIERYWRRNQRRQRGLSLNYTILNVTDNCQSAIFQAAFYDQEEKQTQVISGMLHLHLSPDRKCIVRLTESYIKMVQQKDGTTSSFQRYTQQVRGYVRKHALQIASKIGMFLTNLAVLVLLLFIGIYIFLYLAGPPQWIVDLSLWLFGPPKAVALARAREVTGGGITLLVGLGVPLVALWHSYRRDERRSIRTRTLNYRGHDLDMMDRAYEGADNLVVFSGDFSFLREHNDLCAKIANLAKARKIMMISSKVREDVYSQLASEAHTKALLEQAEAQEVIRYDVPLEIKFSLISHRGRKQILYKYRAPGFGEDEMMCILTETEQSRYLVDVLDKIVAYVRSKS